MGGDTHNNMPNYNYTTNLMPPNKCFAYSNFCELNVFQHSRVGDCKHYFNQPGSNLLVRTFKMVTVSYGYDEFERGLWGIMAPERNGSNSVIEVMFWTTFRGFDNIATDQTTLSHLCCVTKLIFSIQVVYYFSRISSKFFH